MIREVILEGDSILRKQMPDAEWGSGNIVRVLTDLRDTMFSTGAVGFAANQIGELYNICIVRMANDIVLELVNPIILFRKDRYWSPEACLSIPNYMAVVPRSAEIKIGYLTRDKRTKMIALGVPYSIRAQHEIDHLQGILIRDYVDGKNGKSGGVDATKGTIE